MIEALRQFARLGGPQDAVGDFEDRRLLTADVQPEQVHEVAQLDPDLLVAPASRGLRHGGGDPGQQAAQLDMVVAQFSDADARLGQRLGEPGVEQGILGRHVRGELAAQDRDDRPEGGRRLAPERTVVQHVRLQQIQVPEYAEVVGPEARERAGRASRAALGRDSGALLHHADSIGPKGPLWA